MERKIENLLDWVIKNFDTITWEKEDDDEFFWKYETTLNGLLIKTYSSYDNDCPDDRIITFEVEGKGMTSNNYIWNFNASPELCNKLNKLEELLGESKTASNYINGFFDAINSIVKNN